MACPQEDRSGKQTTSRLRAWRVCSRVRLRASLRYARPRPGIAVPPSRGNRRAASPMTSNDNRLLTVEQVAKRLQLSERQVRRLIKRGELRALHIGRRVRIDPRDLKDFLEHCRTA